MIWVDWSCQPGGYSLKVRYHGKDVTGLKRFFMPGGHLQYCTVDSCVFHLFGSGEVLHQRCPLFNDTI